MAFTFGNKDMFVMGVVDQTLYDPTTGDVIGYDRLANDVAIEYTFDLTDITGFNESLVMSIPHTTRLNGTYTSAAFSLTQRALLTGSEVSYNGVARVCEEITATGTALTVTQQPALFYGQSAGDTTGWCYVREKGAATADGTNYGVDLTTKEVQNFTATSGKVYEVTYFTQMASAQSAPLKAAANPSVVSISQRWAVYAAQNGNKESGTLQGYLYFNVPLAMLEGDAGMDGNQTTNSTTSYNWRALENVNNMPECDVCGANTNNLAYYVYVPCGDQTQAVQQLVIVGGPMALTVGEEQQIPVKYLMPDGSVVQPVYTDLSYQSAQNSIATVDANGVVEGATAGDTTITVTLNRSSGGNLTTVAVVNVTA